MDQELLKRLQKAVPEPGDRVAYDETGIVFDDGASLRLGVTAGGIIYIKLNEHRADFDANWCRDMLKLRAMKASVTWGQVMLLVGEYSSEYKEWARRAKLDDTSVEVWVLSGMLRDWLSQRPFRQYLSSLVHHFKKDAL